VVLYKQINVKLRVFTPSAAVTYIDRCILHLIVILNENHTIL